MNDNIKKVAGLAVGTIAGRTLLKGTLKEGAKTPEGQAAISKIALGASKLSVGATKAKLAIGAKAALATKAIGATKVGAVALAAAPIVVPVIAAVGTGLLARKAYRRYKAKKLIRDKNKNDLKDRHNTWEERMRTKHNGNYSDKDLVKDIFYSLMEDKYDGGMGGTGAGSPGMSSVGNMGGSTNRGLRPLGKDEESKAKQFVINKMLRSK